MVRLLENCYNCILWAIIRSRNKAIDIGKESICDGGLVREVLMVS